MSCKEQIVLIQYCTMMITWSLDPETPILGSRNNPNLIFCIKLPISAKNKLMLIQYCNIIITWSLDPETPILGSRNDPTPYFLHKVTYKNSKTCVNYI